jgi:hypothetical protein
LYGVGFTDCKYSIWYVIQAIDVCPAMAIIYPSNHEEQRKIALGLKRKSSVGFKGCAGAVDGFVI